MLYRIIILASALIASGKLSIAATQVYVDAAADFSPANPSNGDLVTWNAGITQAVSGLIYGSNAFNSVQDAIDAVDAGGTVYIAAGSYTEGATLSISKNLSLQGDGAEVSILSGNSNGDYGPDNDEYRVMDITGSTTTVYLKDLTITDGQGNVTGGSSVTNNLGGGIYNTGILTLERCILSNNTVTVGGGIYTSGTLNLNDCTLDGNRGSGGAIHVAAGSATLTSTTLSNNFTYNNAGGIGAAANTSIALYDCVLNSNTAYTGAAIYTHDNVDLVLENCQLTDNETESDGAAIMANRNGSITILNTEIDSNTSSDGMGGGLYIGNATDVTISDSTISNNYAGFHGGGIFNEGTLLMEDSTLASNSAYSGGGLYNETDGTYGNSGDGHASLLRSRITENQARSYRGGGINNSSSGSYSSSTDTSITDNGAVLYLIDCSIDQNSSNYSGGGLANIGTATIENSTFYGNTTTHDGAAIHNYIAEYEYEQSGSFLIIPAKLKLINSTLSGNQTTGYNRYGGGLYNHWGDATLYHCTITDNTATFGGGIYNDKTLRLANSLLLGNTVTGSAGGVNLLESQSITNEGGNIINTPTGYAVADIIATLDNNGGATLTHAIIPDGPAHNAGDNSAIPSGLTTDQRGATRIGGDTVDIGAYEYYDTQPEIISSDPSVNSYELYSGSTITLTADTNLVQGAGEIIVHSNETGGTIPSSFTVSGNSVIITLGSIDGISGMSRFYLEITGNALYSDDGNSVPVNATNAYSYYSMPDQVYIDQAANFTPSFPSIGQNVSWTSASGSSVSDLIYGINAFPEIQDGLNQVTTGGTVYIAASEFAYGSTIQIDRSVSIIGEGPSATILSGEDGYRVFYVSDSATTVEMTNLTIQNGNAGTDNDDFGGGILNESASLYLKDLNFEGNMAGYGGAIMNTEGAIHIYNSAFYQNEAAYGGGGIANVSINASCELNIMNTAFSGNISNSPTSINLTPQGGGAIYNLEPDASMPAVLNIINCTISGNSSVNGNGGGVLSETNTVTNISNSLIVGNQSEISSLSNVAVFPEVTDGNNLFELPDGKALDDLISTYDDHGGSVHSFVLVPDSPAIDAGDNTNLPTDSHDLDQDGDLSESLPLDQLEMSRINSGSVDIGAVEYVAPPLVVSSTPESDSLDFSPSGTLTFTFDQNIIAGPGEISLRRADDGSSAPVTMVIEGNTLTIIPDEALDEGTEYYLHFEPQSISNQAATAYFYQYETFNFTTSVAVTYVAAASDFIPANPTDGETVTWIGASGSVSGLTLGVNAFTSLAEAIEHVEASGTVYIASGTFAAGEQIEITKSLSLQGDGSGQTILSGQDSYRVLYISGSSASVIVNDLTITNGYIEGSNEGGAAIRNESTLTLNRCSLTDNLSRNAGGAIYNTGTTASLTINNCTLFANTASNDPTDAAGIGGAIMNAQAELIINNSTLSGNYARNDGAAINTQSSGSIVTINNSTIINNLSDDFSGGIYKSATAGDVTIRNTIIAGNLGNGSIDWDLSGTYILEGVNFIGSTYGSNGFRSGTDLSFEAGQALSEVIDTELADNGGPTLTHALPGGSVLTNAGDNDVTIDAGLTIDQRGYARISGAQVDIGAVESTVTYVDDLADDYSLTHDQGASGLDDGDTVTWNGSALGAPVAGLTFGTDAFLTINDAIAAASPGTTVYIAQGTYTEGEVIEISQDIHLLGDGASDTVLDGQGTHQILQINADSCVEIAALTIYNGYESGNGAGLQNSGELTLTEIILNQNNSGGHGGAIHNAGTLSVFRSTMFNNYAAGNGGAIHNDGIAELYNSTLSTNYSQQMGAGLSNTGNLTLNQSTLVLNSSPQHGGGIYTTNSATLSINNSLIAGNAAPDAADIMGNFTSLGVNFIGDTSGSNGFRSGTDLSFDSSNSTLVNLIDPSLTDNGGSTPTHSLVDGSPAIDGGDAATLPDALTTDQRGSGYPRTLGSSVDIGSIEFESAVIGAALSASRDNFTLTLDYVVENLGNVALQQVSLTDDLDAVLGGENYTVTTAPAFLVDPGTITLNADFDGNIDTNLFVASSSTLAVGASVQVRLVLTVHTVTGSGTGFGLYSQQASVVANSASGLLSYDFTHNGTDPDPDSDGIANESGENDPTTYSFAELFRTIDGTVWNDLDGNGILDEDEPGLSGFTLYIDVNENGELDEGETSSTTDSDGAYTFSRIQIGSYTLRVDSDSVADGFVMTSASPAASVTLSVGVDASEVNFGYQQQDAVISGSVWYDRNGDGVIDEDESGISGVTLYHDSNDNGTYDAGERSTSSKAIGDFEFGQLAGGSYSIRVDESSLPDGYTRTSSNESYTLTLSAGENNSGNHFGYLIRPVASFSADTLTACAPSDIHFIDSSSNADTWLWDFGDGTTSNEQNPVHTYRKIGSYTVSLTVTNAAFQDSATQTDYISITGYQTVYVDSTEDYQVTNDQGVDGIDIGDTVTWKPGTSAAVSGLIYGYDALSSLQDAVDNLCPDGTIYIAEGNYQEGSTVAIDKGLSLIGDGADSTVLDGEEGYRILDLEDGTGTVIMQGIAFTNGYATPLAQELRPGGGAIRSMAQRLNIYDARFSYNNGSYGAAIYSEGAQLTIHNSTISDNYSVNGSVFVQDSYALIYESKLLNNIASSGGSAVTQVGGILDISSSSIYDNSIEIIDTDQLQISPLPSGGALLSVNEDPNTSTWLYLTNSTITGNSGPLAGALLLSNSTAELNSVTLIENTATETDIAWDAAAGGIYTESGTVSITNSIVAANGSNFSSPDITGSFTSLGVNFIGDPSGSTGFRDGTDLSFTSTETSLEDLLENELAENGGPTPTFALIPGSPALNAGSTNASVISLETDQRGEARVYGDAIDLGAYEFQNTQPTITLLGESSITLECGIDSFIEPGATASDAEDGDLSNQIVISGDTVDTSTPGSYTLRYNVTDSFGSAATERTRTVTVVDTIAPVIILQGDASITLQVNRGSYTEAGAEVSDAGDPDAEVVITGDTVDIDTEGTYIIRYNASDASGNVATEVTRTVYVINPPAVEVTDSATIDRQTGLLLEQVTLTNNSAVTIAGFRLYINNLPEDITVYNAAGSDGDNASGETLPYLLYNYELAPDESVSLEVEFYRASLDTEFTPSYLVEVLNQTEAETEAAEDGIDVERVLVMDDHSILIEISSTPGSNYAIEYSHDLIEWTRINQTITATANRLQWIDNGPPQTPSHPRDVSKRYYRFVEINN
jgi:hypothetical protein